jgi:hypothetical protein
MNIHTLHGGHWSIFLRCVDKTFGILLRNRLFMRGSGCAVDHGGSGMEGITGRSFLAMTPMGELQENTRYRGIMMGQCVGVSVDSLVLTPT